MKILNTILCIGCFLCCAFSTFAQKISGVIRDGKTNEPIIGAIVSLKGTSTGSSTDIDGKFELEVKQALPVTLVISFVGYEPQEIKVTSVDKGLNLKLKSKEVELKGIEITGSRISEKQKESPLTVESMDIIAIKECAQTSFYEALGTLKGVDLTSASLGFTIVNTRGFNSTSPVRSLQIIDGVDNQAPGLNFSLGNFLGCSELDVLKVDMVAGASSAYYGPNAFNGVISMNSRSPFIKPGLEIELKTGERSLMQGALRWAQVFKNKAGKEKFGYKLNAFYMQANDWVADNMEATPQSKDKENNPGGYDAVNRYGDEYNNQNDASAIAVSRPGLGIWYRTGYEEKDIVDYGTKNLKLNAALHYKATEKIEVILSSNFGNGTTVYQGDNRYSLKDIYFYQQRIEVRQEGKFFVRAYTTNENAGNSYDAFLTALLLQNAARSDGQWAQAYSNHWNTSYGNKIRQLPGYPQPNQYPTYTDYVNAINPWLFENYPDTLYKFHEETRGYADQTVTTTGQYPRFVPGTAAFDSAFKAITTTLYTDGGSRFYDKSALTHFHAEYKFTPKFMEITVGGNFREYRPDSKGTIFRDTGGYVIKNREFGFYTGLQKRFIDDKLKIDLSARLDKNENFDYLFSPALSGVYTFNPAQIVRVSLSSAIRNPTLADQYLYYDVGRALLVGNLDGFDSLVTIESLLNELNTQNVDTLDYFNVDPIRPEEVKTVEVGYRTTLFKNLYMDLVGYYSWYKKFIGYKIGASVDYVQAVNLLNVNNIYRVATNSKDEVTTRGVSVGLTYYFKKFFALNGNYSYNVLDRGNSTDPLIPAFNSPEHKYNIGFSARDLDVYVFKTMHIHNVGFNINYKWIQGFDFEGSPQFTGFVPSYNLIDAQITYKVPKIHCTFKLGSSNLFDNRKFTVYGGPVVGRMAYFSALFELSK
ncbi:MAG: TonB-dependent receptor [Bacteroidetes bacterium]|nr:TonB-dependent receptor [Bacteroidota bacterium]MBP6403209.1 TonB-dependent receptor [Bacteroidia bacterium]MBP6648835.1 TonB-dependent receptor [Bacteroidia bacterium]